MHSSVTLTEIREMSFAELDAIDDAVCREVTRFNNPEAAEQIEASRNRVLDAHGRPVTTSEAAAPTERVYHTSNTTTPIRHDSFKRPLPRR